MVRASSREQKDTSLRGSSSDEESNFEGVVGPPGIKGTTMEKEKRLNTPGRGKNSPPVPIGREEAIAKCSLVWGSQVWKNAHTSQ